MTATLNLHPEDRASDLFIDELAVTPSAQRRGVATRLMRDAFALASELGCAQTWVTTEADNDVARAFYESLGVRPRDVVMYEFDA